MGVGWPAISRCFQEGSQINVRIMSRGIGWDFVDKIQTGWYKFHIKGIRSGSGERAAKKMERPLLQGLSCHLVVALVILGAALKVCAGFSPSEVILLPECDRSSDIQKIQ